MTPDELAALQAAAYRDMQPWTAEGFASLLTLPSVQLWTHRHGFLMAQHAADEAEILALATDPAQQRCGCRIRADADG